MGAGATRRPERAEESPGGCRSGLRGAEQEVPGPWEKVRVDGGSWGRSEGLRVLGEAGRLSPGNLLFQGVSGVVIH